MRSSRGSATVAGVIVALASIAGLAVALTNADVVGVALTLLIGVLTVTVQAFSVRHLRGDPRAGRFLLLSAVFAAASVVAAIATTPLVLAIGWTAASAVMLALLATGGSAQTRVAVIRSGVAFAVGDLALWGAVLLALTAAPGTRFADLGGLSSPVALLVGVLVGVAAVARAASVPLHGWLPTTVASTTPVSALLHAGFVNAGALLLFRFDPVPSLAAAAVAGIAGAVTVVAAGAAMLTRGDVKGRLVQSTAAQMGFMLLACSLGGYAVAFVHVIGHALFKASLFLGAGSALERALTARRANPPVPDRPAQATAAGIVILAAGAAVVGTGVWATPSGALLLFVIATGVVAAWQLGAGTRPRVARLLTAAAVAGAVVLYVLLISALDTAAPLTAAQEVMPPVLAVITFLAAIAVLVLAHRGGPLADRVYVLAHAWGRPPLPPPTADLPVDAYLPGPREYRSTP